MFQVLLPAEFREEHRHIVLEFARRGHDFGREEWRQAIVAFDLLKNAAVLTDQGLLPFPVIYRQHVEDPYADELIEALYRTEHVEAAGLARWATVVDYETWKAKVLRCQAQGVTDKGEGQHEPTND